MIPLLWSHFFLCSQARLPRSAAAKTTPATKLTSIDLTYQSPLIAFLAHRHGYPDLQQQQQEQQESAALARSHAAVLHHLAVLQVRKLTLDVDTDVHLMSQSLRSDRVSLPHWLPVLCTHSLNSVSLHSFNTQQQNQMAAAAAANVQAFSPTGFPPLNPWSDNTPLSQPMPPPSLKDCSASQVPSLQHPQPERAPLGALR